MLSFIVALSGATVWLIIVLAHTTDRKDTMPKTTRPFVERRRLFQYAIFKVPKWLQRILLKTEQ